MPNGTQSRNGDVYFKAESAVLDSAASKEKEAHKRLQATAAGGTASKEKRATRGDAKGASPASRGEGENRAI